jgi:hypothetical protein
MNALETLRIKPVADTQSKAVTEPLAKALAKLEISPFDRAEVEKYKNEELERQFSKLCTMARSAGWDDLHARRCGHDKEYMPSVRRQLGDTWTDADRYLMFTRADSYPVCICMGWHRYSAENMSAIPEFVQRKMAQISAEVPGVSFTADVLETQNLPYDPFLIVRLAESGEEYYIEVWGVDDVHFTRTSR